MALAVEYTPGSQSDQPMRETTFHVTSKRDTVRLGRLLASLLGPGDVVGLRGDLGAGKTFLAGSVAHALGVPRAQPVTSPTFNLIKEYRGRIPIYHLDLYRLGDPGELYDLGVWECYEGDGVCLVEWCDRFDDLWPQEALVLTLELGQGERRTVLARAQGRGAKILEGLEKAWREAPDIG